MARQGLAKLSVERNGNAGRGYAMEQRGIEITCNGEACH